MFRAGLLVLMAVTTAACLGGGFLRGEHSTSAELSFEPGATAAEATILALDPTQHRMDITISVVPLDQAGDLDVVIVTDAGTRFQVLSTFQQCSDNGLSLTCQRALPLLLGEQVGDWRVEAERSDATVESSVQVDVKWVPRS